MTGEASTALIALALAECNLNTAVLLKLRGTYKINDVRHCQSHSRCLRQARRLLNPAIDPGLLLLLVDRETGKPQERLLNRFLGEARCSASCSDPHGVEGYRCRGRLLVVAFTGGPESVAERLGHRLHPRLRHRLKSQRVLDEPRGSEAGRIVEELAGMVRECIDTILSSGRGDDARAPWGSR